MRRSSPRPNAPSTSSSLERSRPRATRCTYRNETRQKLRRPIGQRVCSTPTSPRYGRRTRSSRFCDGSQVDDGTAWEIGYAYGKNIQIFGLRTDVRIVQRSDELINLMILESLTELSPTIEQLVHTIRYADRP